MESQAHHLEKEMNIMYVAGRPVKIIHTDNEHENTVNLQARNVSNLLSIMWKNCFKAFEIHNDTHLR